MATPGYTKRRRRRLRREGAGFGKPASSDRPAPSREKPEAAVAKPAAAKPRGGSVNFQPYQPPPVGGRGFVPPQMPEPRPMGPPGPISARAPMDPGMRMGPMGGGANPSPYPQGYGGPGMARPPMDPGTSTGPIGLPPGMIGLPPGGPAMPPGGGRGGFVPPGTPRMGPGAQGGGLQGTGGEEGIQRMPTPGGTRQAPQAPSPGGFGPNVQQLLQQRPDLMRRAMAMRGGFPQR